MYDTQMIQIFFIVIIFSCFLFLLLLFFPLSRMSCKYRSRLLGCFLILFIPLYFFYFQFPVFLFPSISVFMSIDFEIDPQQYLIKISYICISMGHYSRSRNAQLVRVNVLSSQWGSQTGHMKKRCCGNNLCNIYCTAEVPKPWAVEWYRVVSHLIQATWRK